MNHTFRRRAALVGGLAAIALIATACGSDSDEGSGATTTATAGATTTAAGGATTTASGGNADLKGSITVTGSSTVEPISIAVADRFKAEAPNVNVSVSGPGTGDGFEQFCNGEADITDASRAIREEEIEKCAGSGVEFVELKVGIDGLSVVTSAKDTAMTCLSFKDLYALLGPESTGFDTWSSANELAGELAALPEADFGKVNTPYPDAPLTVTAPGEESGTYDSFIELVIAGIAEERGQDPAARPDYTASPNDNVIIQGVAGSDTSLGWVGFAFVEENLDSIKPLEVDGGTGCVEPTPATIADGSYPIARDLFIYVNKAKADESPAVVAFVDLYMKSLADGGVLGTGDGQVPYVPLATAELEAAQKIWTDRTTGTHQS